MSKRKVVENSDVMAELRLPTFLNRAFKGAMNAERQLIRIGMRFPYGGSLLLIAKKHEVTE